MRETILILGGTKEAASLAAQIRANRPEARLITSLAGRTREPAPLAGETRIGGFGGAEGLAQYLVAEAVTWMIDATHPFALQISANARRAAEMTGVPLEVHTRPSWERQDGDRWIEVSDMEAARQAIPAGARVLLAIGAQHIATFFDMDGVTTIARSVDGPLPGQRVGVSNWLIGKPSTDWREEAQFLESYAITHIVCRNSGGTGAYAKIEAARRLGLTVIMVTRTS